MAKSTLEIIEELRQELVFKIQNLTKLSINDVTVDVTLTPEEYVSTYVLEAKGLGWYLEKNKISEHDNLVAWYTSDIPRGGSTTVFLDTNKC